MNYSSHQDNHNIRAWRTWSWVSSGLENVKRLLQPWCTQRAAKVILRFQFWIFEGSRDESTHKDNTNSASKIWHFSVLGNPSGLSCRTQEGSDCVHTESMHRGIFLLLQFWIFEVSWDESTHSNHTNSVLGTSGTSSALAQNAFG